MVNILKGRQVLRNWPFSGGEQVGACWYHWDHGVGVGVTLWQPGGVLFSCPCLRSHHRCHLTRTLGSCPHARGVGRASAPQDTVLELSPDREDKKHRCFNPYSAQCPLECIRTYLATRNRTK